MLPLILVCGALVGAWYYLGSERKRQNLDPKKVSRLEILKDKLKGPIAEHFYNKLQKEYKQVCDELQMICENNYKPLSDEESMRDFYIDSENDFPENSRKALQNSHRLLKQISHLHNFITKEANNKCNILGDYSLELTRLSIKATALEIKLIEGFFGIPQVKLHKNILEVQNIFGIPKPKLYKNILEFQNY